MNSLFSRRVTAAAGRMRIGTMLTPLQQYRNFPTTTNALNIAPRATPTRVFQTRFYSTLRRKLAERKAKKSLSKC